MMEHRLANRHEIETQVRIYLAGIPIGVGQVVEISASGLRIEHTDLNLAVGQILNIEFLDLDGVEGYSSRIRAMVIHVSSDQLGLMFDHDLNVDDFIVHLQQINSFHKQYMRRCYG